MAVVKGTQSAAILKDAIVLDLSDLRRQAAKLQAAAEAKAARIVASAEAQASAVETRAHDQAYEKGFELGKVEGYEAGRKQGAEEARAEARPQLESIEKAWQEALGKFQGHHDKTVREAKHAVLDLGLKMAERVVHRVIEVDATVIVDQVASALGYVLKPYDVSVRINSVDKPMVEEAMPQLMRELKQFEHVALVEDDTVSPGGCVLSYGQGKVDAQIETQLERVIQLMLPDETNVVDEWSGEDGYDLADGDSSGGVGDASGDSSEVGGEAEPS